MSVLVMLSDMFGSRTVPDMRLIRIYVSSKSAGRTKRPTRLLSEKKPEAIDQFRKDISSTVAQLGVVCCTTLFGANEQCQQQVLQVSIRLTSV
eukprot:5999429-Amphidinium_carterae.2